MKNIIFTGLSLLLINISGVVAQVQDKVILVIHGGAGTILKKNMSPEKEKAYRAVLTESLMEGYKLLKSGANSVVAVERAIHVLENSPLFNAGKGAVFTHDGKNELDASIMYSKNGQAGAVAGVTTIKNPISAAIAVMEKSNHVMMVGKGAEEFAKSHHLTLVEPSYFYTKERWEGLQRILERDAKKVQLDHDQKQSYVSPKDNDEKFGTVGGVALDQFGDIAAGTSTGGMTNKMYGRVGDAPIIGAGTYANKEVGISCTGWGEFFIRHVAAYDVAALMQYKKISGKMAGDEVIHKIDQSGGDGGMIILDKDGNVAMPFNTAGMYRGYITESGKVTIEIYK